MQQRVTRGLANDEAEIATCDAELVSLFFALETQWRWHPMAGVRQGIDYQAVRPTADLLGVEMTPRIMADIRMMEIAALEEFARAAKGAGRGVGK